MVASRATAYLLPKSKVAIPFHNKPRKSQGGPYNSESSVPGLTKPVSSEPVPSIRESTETDIASICESDLHRQMLRATDVTAGQKLDDEG